eukprot:565959_1
MSNLKRRFYVCNRDETDTSGCLSKLDPTTENTIPCLFQDIKDQQSFETLFQIIDSSKLIRQMNVTHPISQTIAVFANGKWEPCANTECDHMISVLHQDSSIHNDDPIKTRYKRCKATNVYFCEECMDKRRSKYPLFVVLNGEKWTRAYSKEEKMYFWKNYSSNESSWNPWRDIANTNAPWITSKQKYTKFKDDLDQPYWYNYENGNSTYIRPMHYVSSDEILYDSAADDEPTDAYNYLDMPCFL